MKEQFSKKYQEELIKIKNLNLSEEESLKLKAETKAMILAEYEEYFANQKKMENVKTVPVVEETKKVEVPSQIIEEIKVEVPAAIEEEINVDEPVKVDEIDEFAEIDAIINRLKERESQPIRMNMDEDKTSDFLSPTELMATINFENEVDEIAKLNDVDDQPVNIEPLTTNKVEDVEEISAELTISSDDVAFSDNLAKQMDTFTEDDIVIKQSPDTGESEKLNIVEDSPVIAAEPNATEAEVKQVQSEIAEEPIAESISDNQEVKVEPETTQSLEEEIVIISNDSVESDGTKEVTEDKELKSENINANENVGNPVKSKNSKGGLILDISLYVIVIILASVLVYMISKV